MKEHTEECQRLNKEIDNLKKHFETIKPLPATTPLSDRIPLGISSSQFQEILLIKNEIKEKEKELQDYCNKNCKYE